jgi:hypothetical protein
MIGNQRIFPSAKLGDDPDILPEMAVLALKPGNDGFMTTI